MQIKIESSSPETFLADALAVFCFESESSDPSVAEQSGWLREIRSSGEFSGKFCELSLLHRPEGIAAKRLVVAGAGKQENFSPAQARKASGALVRSLRSKGVRNLALLAREPYSPDEFEALIEGAILGAWEPSAYKSEKDEKQIERFVILAPGADNLEALRAASERAQLVAESQNFARALINEPPNKLNPAALAQAARQMATETGLACEVLDRDGMAKLGMGALLGVAQGSANPPFLIVLQYRPDTAAPSGDHLALIGKGVTFDTGGISIKSADGMEKMKYDMAGAAAVIGAMRAIAHQRPAIPVTGYIPTVENMLGGNAQRPSDIVTSYSGKTIEVLNTDAEGRLILADAITYAIRNGATHLVDAATLTGAIGVALGHYNMGAFTNDQPFLDSVLAAVRAAGEKAWQLPLEEEYKDYLKSPFADLPNIGGRQGGAIIAAWFLREFADPTPWVHFDIASTAWIDETKPWIAKGPSGVALRSFVKLASTWPR